MMHILIAEDDVTNQLLLQSFLAEYGDCHLATNGKEAVEAFRAVQKTGQRYRLICLDIMMPEMDGQTALKEIRALEDAAGTRSAQRVKIIMTTALNDKESVIQSIMAGCDAYLVKPINKNELHDRLMDLNLA